MLNGLTESTSLCNVRKDTNGVKRKNTLLDLDTITTELLSTAVNSLYESTAHQLTFEWSHTRVSSTDVKVRTTLYNIINSIK